MLKPPTAEAAEKECVSVERGKERAEIVKEEKMIVTDVV